jgi:hypothetical protein
MFAAQLAGGIITFVYKDAFQTGMVDAMRNLIGNYNEEEAARNAWDRLQIDVKHKFTLFSNSHAHRAFFAVQVLWSHLTQRLDG